MEHKNRYFGGFYVLQPEIYSATKNNTLRCHTGLAYLVNKGKNMQFPKGFSWQTLAADDQSRKFASCFS